MLLAKCASEKHCFSGLNYSNRPDARIRHHGHKSVYAYNSVVSPMSSMNPPTCPKVFFSASKMSSSVT